MNIQAVKTHKIRKKGNIIDILDKYIAEFTDNSVLIITSKIVSICEGRVKKVGKVNKQDLIHQEANLYLPPESNKYNFSLSITHGLLTPAAGIDESNADGYYILWPKDPQQTANDIREYLVKRFSLKHVGVIITDSRTMPLRWGTIGAALAHSGFEALNDYRNTPDIFGRIMQVTQANIAEALAASSVVVMGEGAEQTPLAIINDVPFVHFQDRNPSKEELEALTISIEEDIYAPLLTSVTWKKGEGK
jgi:putative folate metabolism gamma-glutamate ligase